MSKGIGGHTKTYRGATEVWLTPPHIVPALGHFDLDPCAAPSPRPWDTAMVHYDITTGQDGLSLPWAGRVWCNPPYGPETEVWLKRMAEHNHGTALTFARTETATWAKHIWPNASAILFLTGRLYFHRPNGSRGPGNAGGPSALIAYGTEDAERLRSSGLPGFIVSGATETTKEQHDRTTSSNGSSEREGGRTEGGDVVEATRTSTHHRLCVGRDCVVRQSLPE